MADARWREVLSSDSTCTPLFRGSSTPTLISTRASSSVSISSAGSARAARIRFRTPATTSRDASRDENIIVTRDASGGVNALFNVCRHRGTRLCEQPEGHFVDRIQCPYHAWTYDLDGRLLAAPHMAPDVLQGRLPAASRRLRSVGRQYLREPREPEASAARRNSSADLPERFARWRMQDLRLVRRIVYDVKANWKLIVLNYNECLHCPNAPSDAEQAASLPRRRQRGSRRRATAAARWDSSDGVETMSMDGKRRRDYLPGLSASRAAAGRRTSRSIRTLLLSLHPDYMMTHTLWPRANDRTEIVCEWHFHPDEIAKPDFHADDAIEFWDLTNREDWWIAEQSQAGINSRCTRRGRIPSGKSCCGASTRSSGGKHNLFREPICIQLGTPIAHEQPARVRLCVPREIDVRVEYLVGALRRAGDHDAVRTAHERLAGERQPLLPVPRGCRARRNSRSETRRRASPLCTGLPAIHRPSRPAARPRDPRRRPRARACTPGSAGRNRSRRRSCRPSSHTPARRVARCVVALFVKAGVVGDVDHARAPEQRAVGVDHGRAVERPIAVALEQIEHGDDAELARLRGKRVRQRAGQRLRRASRTSRTGGILRIERLEGELGEADELGALRAQPSRTRATRGRRCRPCRSTHAAEPERSMHRVKR